jgi:hypothetical protein
VSFALEVGGKSVVCRELCLMLRTEIAKSQELGILEVAFNHVTPLRNEHFGSQINKGSLRL